MKDDCFPIPWIFYGLHWKLFRFITCRKYQLLKSQRNLYFIHQIVGDRLDSYFIRLEFRYLYGGKILCICHLERWYFWIWRSNLPGLLPNLLGLFERGFRRFWKFFGVFIRFIGKMISFLSKKNTVILPLLINFWDTKILFWYNQDDVKTYYVCIANHNLIFWIP